MKFSKKALIIASALWFAAFFAFNLFQASPHGKMFWSYNNDAKGGGPGYAEKTWACPARNSGYWPCTPQDGIQSAIIGFPLAVIVSLFIPLFLLLHLLQGGNAPTPIEMLLNLFFSPIGLFLLYLPLSYLGQGKTRRAK